MHVCVYICTYTHTQTQTHLDALLQTLREGGQAKHQPFYNFSAASLLLTGAAARLSLALEWRFLGVVLRGGAGMAGKRVSHESDKFEHFLRGSLGGSLAQKYLCNVCGVCVHTYKQRGAYSCMCACMVCMYKHKTLGQRANRRRILVMYKHTTPGQRAYPAAQAPAGEQGAQRAAC